MERAIVQQSPITPVLLYTFIAPPSNLENYEQSTEDSMPDILRKEYFDLMIGMHKSIMQAINGLIDKYPPFKLIYKEKLSSIYTRMWKEFYKFRNDDSLEYRKSAYILKQVFGSAEDALHNPQEINMEEFQLLYEEARSTWGNKTEDFNFYELIVKLLEKILPELANLLTLVGSDKIKRKRRTQTSQPIEA